jgi:hypothetical protein
MVYPLNKSFSEVVTFAKKQGFCPTVNFFFTENTSLFFAHPATLIVSDRLLLLPLQLLISR